MFLLTAIYLTCYLCCLWRLSRELILPGFLLSFPAVEHEHESSSSRVLRFYWQVITLRESWLVRCIAPKLQTSEDMACHHTLKRSRNSVEVLLRARGKAIMIVVVLIPGCKRILLGGCVLHVSGNSRPEDRIYNARNTVAAAVISVGHQRQL